MMMTSNDIDKLWRGIDRHTNDECWPWLAGHNGPGYGVLYATVDGVRRGYLAHRLVLALQGGQLPPSRTFALHACDNPPCCNPRHLRWGTPTDNRRDATIRGRGKNPPIVRHNPEWEARRLAAMPKGSKQIQAILTEKIVAKIYRMRLCGMTGDAVAAKLGVSNSVVGDVYSGKSWKHCLGVDGNPTLEQLRAVRAKPENVILDAAKVAEIRKALAGGEMGISIAARFGVHKATISDIKLGKIWRTV